MRIRTVGESINMGAFGGSHKIARRRCQVRIAMSLDRPGKRCRPIGTDRSVPLPAMPSRCHCSRMPKPHLLETFANPYPARDYLIAMECPEFTSLCPLGGIETDAAELKQLEGGAPDFATMHINYVPADVCVELKSLKLYLWSFRNDGIFYERAVNRILDDLSEAVKPAWMEVVGDFNIRGGIKSVITAHVGARR